MSEISNISWNACRKHSDKINESILKKIGKPFKSYYKRLLLYWRIFCALGFGLTDFYCTIIAKVISQNMDGQEA